MNQETEKVIREYRFTVLVMGGIIIFCMVFMVYLLFVYVPDMWIKLSVQAFNQVWDERLVPDNQ